MSIIVNPDDGPQTIPWGVRIYCTGADINNRSIRYLDDTPMDVLCGEATSSRFLVHMNPIEEARMDDELQRILELIARPWHKKLLHNINLILHDRLPSKFDCYELSPYPWTDSEQDRLLFAAKLEGTLAGRYLRDCEVKVKQDWRLVKQRWVKEYYVVHIHWM